MRRNLAEHCSAAIWFGPSALTAIGNRRTGADCRLLVATPADAGVRLLPAVPLAFESSRDLELVK